jgi:5'-nucleotidase
VRKYILLTNDDGITAPGIQILRDTVARVWDCVSVAPDSEQSAQSHALTLTRPLRVKEIGEGVMSVDGTPTDCVMLALRGLLERRPDLVISGINSGANLGDDVIYSGTVAGAAEATILGVPAISVSIVEPDKTDITWAAEIALKVAGAVLEKSLPEGVFLNVNIPPEWTGKRFEITCLGTRSYRDVITRKLDPRGRPYYWIGGQMEAWKGTGKSDFAAIDRGNISVTPLHLDMTATHVIAEMESWSFE